MSSTLILDKIEDLANEVYRTLGPGHTELVYHNAMLVELRLNDIPFESEVVTNFFYKGEPVGSGRADIVVNGNTVIELKALKDIWPNSYYKLDVYMKSLKLGRGLMINFPQRLGYTGTEVRRFKCTRYCETF